MVLYIFARSVNGLSHPIKMIILNRLSRWNRSNTKNYLIISMTQTLINQSRWDLKTTEDCVRSYQLNMSSKNTFFRRHPYLNDESCTTV